jgi:hypothetical protein
MKNKQLKLQAMLWLLAGVGALQAQTTLQVKPKAGTQTAYSLSSVRKLTFPVAGSMSVSKVNGGSDSYELSDLRYLKYADLGTSIQQGLMEKSGLRLYPNPVADVLTLEWPGSGQQPATVELLSVDGKLQCRAELALATGPQQIGVSHLKAGLYLCRVSDGARVVTTKFYKR